MNNICNHKIAFLEESKDYGNHEGRMHEWILKSECLLCGGGLKDEEIKIALSQMYAQEIAELVFVAYQSKRACYEALSKLSANGITTSLSPQRS